MFERLKKLYDAGRLSKAGLAKAVQRDWITAEEYDEITGEAGKLTAEEYRLITGEDYEA